MKQRLTDTQIDKARPKVKPYKLTDGGGLLIEIRPKGARSSGTKLWRYRYRIDDKENVYALGEYIKAPIGETEERAKLRRAGGQFTLLEARDERDRCRGLVKQSIHPAKQKKTDKLLKAGENANTFEAVAREWMGKKVGGWSPYYAKQVKRFLEADVFPEIGALPMRSLTAAHLLPIIQKVEKRGAKTVAVLIRQWCSMIFRYAVSTLRADADHAAALKGAVERDEVQHHKPLALGDIPAFLKAVEGYGGYQTTTIAMKLLLLTFVRPVELRGAEWTEFDLDAGMWIIPGIRMKMRREHLVPLSAQAVALLRDLHAFTGGQRWLLPNYRRPKTFMTGTTLNRALERMGYGGRFSSHGFRATASTALNDIGYRSDVIECQLAHKERNSSRNAYNRAQYLEERKKMMREWSDLVLSNGVVVAGRFGKQATA
jgi:integrase